MSLCSCHFDGDNITTSVNGWLVYAWARQCCVCLYMWGCVSCFFVIVQPWVSNFRMCLFLCTGQPTLHSSHTIFIMWFISKRSMFSRQMIPWWKDGRWTIWWNTVCVPNAKHLSLKWNRFFLAKIYIYHSVNLNDQQQNKTTQMTYCARYKILRIYRV